MVPFVNFRFFGSIRSFFLVPFVFGMSYFVVKDFLGGGFRYFLISLRKLGKIPIFTNIFQMGRSTTN